jgi:hypothetical protein
MSPEQLVVDVRRSVAEAHGLPEAAAGLLVGDTFAELDASAQTLSALLAKHPTDPKPGPEESEPQTMADVIAASTVAKKERQAALIASLHPAAPEPMRDGQGRFAASPSSGLDGGARPLVPQTSPAADHNSLIAELAAFSKLGHSQF